MSGDGRDDDALAVGTWTAGRRWLGTSFGDIAYVERGSGEAAALFLHGFPLNSFQWRGALERLSGLRRCIAPDALGLGHTAVRPWQAVAFADQAAMLGEILDRLGLATVDVVANDSNTGVA